MGSSPWGSGEWSAKSPRVESLSLLGLSALGLLAKHLGISEKHDHRVVHAQLPEGLTLDELRALPASTTTGLPSLRLVCAFRRLCSAPPVRTPLAGAP